MESLTEIAPQKTSKKFLHKVASQRSKNSQRHFYKHPIYHFKAEEPHKKRMEEKEETKPWWCPWDAWQAQNPKKARGSALPFSTKRPSHSSRHVKATHKQMRLVEVIPGGLHNPERSMEIVVEGSEEKGRLRTSSSSKRWMTLLSGIWDEEEEEKRELWRWKQEVLEAEIGVVE